MIFAILLNTTVHASDSYLNSGDREWAVQPSVEFGFVAPFSNSIQFGKNGTDFDYVKDGGQDNLFKYSRWELAFHSKKGHGFRFLYQPLDVVSTQELDRDTIFDAVTFPGGTPMQFRYGFDYYRASYTYDVWRSDNAVVSMGGSLQLRNATLDFRSLDGEQQNSNRDIGPVPLLKIRAKWQQSPLRFWEFEADGAYAPIKYLNGDVSDVIGALLDTSVKGGFVFDRGLEAFMTLRYIGGGAEGTDDDPEDGKDGFVANWIHAGVVSLGFSFR